jgi:hypothetical protein
VSLIVIIEDLEGGDVRNSVEVKSVSTNLQNRMEHSETMNKYLMGFPTGYWIVRDSDFPSLAKNFLSPDASATFMMWNVNRTEIYESSEKRVSQLFHFLQPQQCLQKNYDRIIHRFESSRVC